MPAAANKPVPQFYNVTSVLTQDLSARFAILAGAALAFLGGAYVIGSLGQSQMLDSPDPVFNLPFRRLMLVMGIIQLAASLILLFTRGRTGVGLVAWLTANLLAYRICLWTMGWRHSSGFMVDPLGLSPATTDQITSLISLYLLAGSCASLWLAPRFARKRAQQLQPMPALNAPLETRPAAYVRLLKISCATCGGHIEFPSNFCGGQIPCPHCQAPVALQKPVNLKMSCGFCQGHLEFPDYALGEKIPCPHCQANIILTKTHTAN